VAIVSDPIVLDVRPYSPILAARPFGHRAAVVIHISGPSVQRQSRFIPAIHFQVNRFHTKRASAVRNKVRRPRPKARARILRLDLQFIDKRIAPARFKN
jgi:hypothetical protein